MPKSAPSHDASKAPHDEQARLSDVALRKKKNADAQAAFRQRRANYIATLEETVTKLESVVVDLQNSNRDATTEILEWKQQHARMRLEFREREKYWRMLWQTRKSGQGTDDIAPLPPSSTATMLLANNISASQLQYPNDGMGYRNEDACRATFNGSEPNSYTASPSLPLVEPDPTLSPEDSAGRLPKYTQYPYGQPESRDPSRWSLNGALSTDGTHQHSQSPTYLESPSLATPDMTYNGRGFGATEDHKMHNVLDSAPYSFSNEERFGHRVADGAVPGSRSMSPSSTVASTSSALPSTFQFPFSDTAGQPNDRREFDFRRHSLPQGGEVTLHGGTADISSLSGMPAPQDVVRYRLGARKSENQDPQSQHRSTPLPTLMPLPTSGLGLSNDGTTTPHHEHDRAASIESDGASHTSRLRRRRGAFSSSRSPSPGPPSLSCTVAVIKAQAFGALRRTRARGKKSSEGAAKVAMDVLEARGIGMGAHTSSKRPRIDTDSLAMET